MSNSDIQQFREWLEKMKHLPNDVEDHYIRSFILAAKGSLQKAKTVYEKFHMLRHADDYDFNWDPLSEDYLLNKKYAIVKLPKKSPEGYNILITKVIDPEPDETLMVKHSPTLLSAFLVWLWDNQMDDCQFIMLFDWDNITFSDLKGINSTRLENFTKAASGGLPVRAKKILDINVPQLLEWAFQAIKPLLSAKINQRRFAYAKSDVLTEHIPKENLPSDYGGDLPSVAELNGETKKLFAKYRDRFLKMKDSLEKEAPFIPSEFRPDDSNTFRKLEVD